MSPRPRIVAGCMTGTSLDGIDVAVARIHGRGLAQRAELLALVSRPLGPLADPLRRLAEQQPATAGAIADLAHRFALLHARVLAPLHRRFPLDLVCIHGQTVFHKPPLSWQLFQPAPVAAALGVPVVCDVRAADLAAGGQGAPVTPITDWILFRDRRRRVAVVNLGGFANATLLPPGAVAGVRGGDCCACNQVLDAVARTALGKPYDRGGAAARRGLPDPGATAALVRILDRQRRGRRSLGTGDEAAAWVQAHRGLPPRDLARSACAAVARTIAAGLRDLAGSGPIDRVVVAGGGARNHALVADLATATACPVAPSDDHGVPVQAREALAFACIGVLCADGVPITLPAVTGVRRPPRAGLTAPAP
jgi:anhydro-N-acetylmuramic acid kinase